MIALRAPNLLASGTIAHAFLGRTGGVSKGIYESLNCGGRDGRDEKENITENRQRAAAVLGTETALVTLKQVHGTRTIVVDKPWSYWGAVPEADAMVTAEPGIALGILAADCAPVLLADVESHIIGAAHAGWKGALAGIVESAVQAMESLGAQRSRIAAAIGPCISQASYEVDAAFRERFVASAPFNARFFEPGLRLERFQFDLEDFVFSQLNGAGITSIWRAGACTYQRESEFFSYRRATHRSENDYGRQVSAIRLCK